MNNLGEESPTGTQDDIEDMNRVETELREQINTLKVNWISYKQQKLDTLELKNELGMNMII